MYLNTLNNYSAGVNYFDIEDTHSINHISYRDRKSLLNLPLNWLSKLLNKNGIKYIEDDDIIIIDDMDNLPEEITKHIQPFYAIYYPALNKCNNFICSSGVKEYEGTFDSFVEYLKREKDRYVSYTHLNGNYFLFNGIKLRNFYNLMFHSTLKQKEILRYLDATEFDYSIDTNKIKEEVEKILAKH